MKPSDSKRDEIDSLDGQCGEFSAPPVAAEVLGVEGDIHPDLPTLNFLMPVSEIVKAKESTRE